MYRSTLERIGLTTRDLRAYSSVLYGFGGEGTASMGVVDLPVTLGEYPLSVTKMTEFVVEDINAAYNS